MALTTDELAMRNALHELTGDQPDAPIDRLVAVRRRHTRRRMAQSVAATLGVAALVAAGLAVSAALPTTHHHQAVTATRAQSWQLTWPERTDGTVDKRRVLAWVHEQAFPDLGHVRWLYAATAPGTVDKWAVLEADYPSDPAPIRAHGLFTAVSHDGGDTWSVQMHGAPAVTTPVLGVATQQGHAVLALTAPAVTAVELVKVHREDAVDTESFPPVTHGATILTSSSALPAGSVFVRPQGAASTFAVLFDGDAQAQGRAPWLNAEPLHVHGEHFFGTMSGGAGGGFTQRPDYTGTLVFRVRCAGPVPLVLAVTTPGASQDLTVDRCDGLFHAFAGPAITRGQKLHVDVSGDQGETLAVISVAVRP